MKKIDTSSITTSAGMAFKSGVMNHLQQSFQEILAALANSIVGNNYDPTKVYVLVGCANSGTGLAYVLTAGAVFYNGEIYLMDANSFVATSGQVAVPNIVTTFATAANGDPVQFTDGTSHQVLQIRKVVLSSGVTGSGGLPDFSAWIRAAAPSAIVIVNAAYGAAQTMNFRQDQILYYTTGITGGTFALHFDFVGAVPGTVVSMKIVAGSGVTFNVDTPSGSNIVNLAGAITFSKTNYLTAEYMGKNDAGNDEVRYSVVSL